MIDFFPSPSQSINHPLFIPFLFVLLPSPHPLFSSKLRIQDEFVLYDVVTFDQSPGTFSAGQSILLQSCDVGSVGFAPLHFESDTVLYFPLVSSWRHSTWRFWTPFPHVLEQGRQPETYQLKGELSRRLFPASINHIVTFKTVL